MSARDYRRFRLENAENLSRESSARFTKARHWQAFSAIDSAISSAHRTAWLGRENPNLDMADWKSDALACPKRAAEPVSVELHNPFEMLEFREPYRICGVQSFGDKWADRRKCAGSAD
jgi:hypothetical protein